MVVDFLRLIDRPYAGGASSNFLLQTAAVRYRLRDRTTRQPFTLDLLSTVHRHGQRATLAAPQLGSCASSGRS